jgi:hypothetical protein
MPSKWLLRFRELSGEPSKYFSPPARADSAISAVSPAGLLSIGANGAIGTHGKKENVVPTTERWGRLYKERVALGGTRGAWAEMQCRWHMERGERIPRDICAGCRKAIGATALELIDGCRVYMHDNHACLIAYGERWRMAATRALLELGLIPPGHSASVVPGG